MDDDMKRWRRLVEHGPSIRDILLRKSKRVIACGAEMLMGYVLGVCLLMEALRISAHDWSRRRK